MSRSLTFTTTAVAGSSWFGQSRSRSGLAVGPFASYRTRRRATPSFCNASRQKSYMGGGGPLRKYMVRWRERRHRTAKVAPPGQASGQAGWRSSRRRVGDGSRAQQVERLGAAGCGGEGVDHRSGWAAISVRPARGKDPVAARRGCREPGMGLWCRSPAAPEPASTGRWLASPSRRFAGDRSWDRCTTGRPPPGSGIYPDIRRLTGTRGRGARCSPGRYPCEHGGGTAAQRP